jgi:hypothetical protein
MYFLPLVEESSPHKMDTCLLSTEPYVLKPAASLLPTASIVARMLPASAAPVESIAFYKSSLKLSLKELTTHFVNKSTCSCLRKILTKATSSLILQNTSLHRHTAIFTLRYQWVMSDLSVVLYETTCLDKVVLQISIYHHSMTL